MSISYNSLVQIRFNYFQTFPNSGNTIKNGIKVLWIMSEADSIEIKNVEIYGELLCGVRILEPF